MTIKEKLLIKQRRGFFREITCHFINIKTGVSCTQVRRSFQLSHDYGHFIGEIIASMDSGETGIFWLTYGDTEKQWFLPTQADAFAVVLFSKE